MVKIEISFEEKNDGEANLKVKLNKYATKKKVTFLENYTSETLYLFLREKLGKIADSVIVEESIK